jgi:ribonuclease P protein component
VFFIGTGIWPLLHRTSFERVTGAKRDFWLAQTVGVAVASIGAGLAQAAAAQSRVPREMRTVAMTSAAGLAALDVVFVARRRISPVYLADAAAEAALVVGWLTAKRD